jgi:hypothetical protein
MGRIGSHGQANTARHGQNGGMHEGRTSGPTFGQLTAVRHGQTRPTGRPHHGATRRRFRQRGVALITLAVWSVALFGAVGLSVDVGRLFLNKNEAQTFVDSAALDAARRLDGTTAGIEAARQAVEQNRNRWDFATQPFRHYLLEFATSAAPERWTTTPRPPDGYDRVRLTVSATQKLWFLPVLVSKDSQLVIASAVAAQTPVTTYYQGLFPLAVAAAGSAPAFGLAPGEKFDVRLTTRWWGDSRPAVLAARVLTDHHGGALDEPPGNASLAQEMLPMKTVVRVGEPLPLAGSVPVEVEALLAERAGQDTDILSASYAAYRTTNKGNGRRLLQLPIFDAGSLEVLGTGLFLLGPPGNAGTLEFTGMAALPNSVTPGAGRPGIYQVRLIQ